MSSDTLVHLEPGPDGQSLLDALHARGIEHPFQCKAGYCGRCRVKLVSGQVRTRDALAALNPGEVLACCSQVHSPVQLALLGK